MGECFAWRKPTTTAAADVMELEKGATCSGIDIEEFRHRQVGRRFRSGRSHGMKDTAKEMNMELMKNARERTPSRYRDAESEFINDI